MARCGGGNCGGDDRISGRLGLSQPPHPAPPEPPPPPPPAVGWQQCAGSERGTGIEGESGRWSATHGTAAAPTGRGTTTVATEIVALVVEVEVQAAMIGGAGARPGAGAGLGQGGRGRSGSRDGWERECERERDREREDPAGRASVGGGGSGSGLARGSSFGHSGPGGSRVSRANSTAMMAAPRDVHAPTGGRPPPVAAGLWARVSRRAGGLAAPCPGMDLALHPAVSALLLHCPSGLRGSFPDPLGEKNSGSRTVRLPCGGIGTRTLPASMCPSSPGTGVRNVNEATRKGSVAAFPVSSVAVPHTAATAQPPAEERTDPGCGAQACAPAAHAADGRACSWAARPVPNPYPLGRPNPDPGTWHQCGAAAARLGFRPAGRLEGHHRGSTPAGGSGRRLAPPPPRVQHLRPDCTRAAAWGPSRVRPPALRRPLPPSSMLWLQALGF
ncbi:hypothetical protein PLESTB_000740800 [Pleodorina starrii]|uniref:Uncharacterized protein n=1 Tax=Pleodorina starrii TaxID=330485 RepID=A0A9W6F2I5_9CHLO|nr:hypothetical protein PLESTB_000740800 [Pleodorina starrii]